MSLAVIATFACDWIVAGLADGTLERIGGVIREVGTQKVVAWLREFGANTTQVPKPKESSQVNNSDNLLNQYSPVSYLPLSIPKLKGSLQVNNSDNVLNFNSDNLLKLSVSMMDFAAVIQRIKELEQRLRQAEELLKKINRKIDIGYYANFKAALGLAANAFTMNKRENRESMAIQAINRFLEAQHIYTEYTDTELEKKSQIADEYLLTLSLAYLAEARCHLEIGEYTIALSRFQEGAAVLRERIQKYINILLTSNPAAYLMPWYKGEIDLLRLTRVYQWIDPLLDENAVFEMQRQNLVNLVRDPNKWVISLPPAILDRLEVQGGWFGVTDRDLTREAEKRLPQVMEVMESMIETNRRFQAYQAEVQAIAQLGMSFHDWLKLAPKETKPDGAELMYIIPSKPLEV